MPDRIAVAGNSQTWRRGMAAVLSDAGYQVTVVETTDQFRPGEDGLALVVGLSTTEIQGSVIGAIEDNPHIPVFLVVPDLDLVHLAEVLRLGAAGVAEEDAESEILLTSLAATLRGLVAIPKSSARELALLVPEPTDDSALLSQNEIDWLRAMATGTTVAELAEEWGYSERAMFRNLKGLYVRIGVSNRTEALLWASRQALLST